MSGADGRASRRGRALRRLARLGTPAALLALILRPGLGTRRRFGAAAALGTYWTAVHLRYRRRGRAVTTREYDLLRSVDWATFTRHYNERVPTIEEEFELWGPYHQHRAEQRYDLVAAAVRRYVPTEGRPAVLDVGAGSLNVADRLPGLRAHYAAIDLPAHHVVYAARKYRLGGCGSGLHVTVARGRAEELPYRDSTFDVVVLSEVIEHLIRPELAVWEIARVLRPGGVVVLTTNNASEAPLRSPLSHPLAWVEKALGTEHPRLVSLRPWVWPVPVDRALVPDGAPDVYLPHTHHILAETRALLAAGGLDTIESSTFEFPPPQSATAKRLEAAGRAGLRAADTIELAATHTPGLRWLGCHLFLVARKHRTVAGPPPPGVWPGPFS